MLRFSETVPKPQFIFREVMIQAFLLHFASIIEKECPSAGHILKVKNPCLAYFSKLAIPCRLKGLHINNSTY